MTTDKTTTIIAKLRYMARQYTSGSFARGGNPAQPHYLDEAANAIERHAKELQAYELTVSSLREQLAARGVPALARDVIRAIFIEHGFTVKEGQTDLKEYVYDAAKALLDAASPQPAAQPERDQWHPPIGVRCTMSRAPSDHEAIKAIRMQIAAAPQPAAQPATRPEPPLLGRWHHGNGVLCSGTLRIATWDCDTNPPDEFRDEVLDWVCSTLTAAITEPAAQPHPLDSMELKPSVNTVTVTATEFCKIRQPVISNLTGIAHEAKKGGAA